MLYNIALSLLIMVVITIVGTTAAALLFRSHPKCWEMTFFGAISGLLLGTGAGVMASLVMI